MPTVRVLVADDHDLVRKGLRSLIEGQNGWELVAEAADGREAVTKSAQLKPDVAIVDISMPSLNGLDATRQIVKQSPKTRVLILTFDDSDELIHAVLDAGAQGYLLKTDAMRDIVAAVDALRNNKTFFTTKVAQVVLDGYRGKTSDRTNDHHGVFARLTPREREVVQLIAEGKSSKEIAVTLGISVKTVETHRTNVMRTLDCHSQVDLVRYAIRNRITSA